MLVKIIPNIDSSGGSLTRNVQDLQLENKIPQNVTESQERKPAETNTEWEREWEAAPGSPGDESLNRATECLWRLRC